jgi:ribosomal protein S25
MIIRLLHKEAERVELKKIIEEITIADVAKTLRELSLIDGVVFLTRNGVGLSLATRLVDDLHAWKEKHVSTRQDDRRV